MSTIRISRTGRRVRARYNFGTGRAPGIGRLVAAPGNRRFWHYGTIGRVIRGAAHLRAWVIR